MSDNLIPSVTESVNYYNDLAHVMTKKEVIEYFSVSRHEVEYAQENGHVIFHRDGNTLFYSSTSVLDWVRKKYGAEVLTRGMRALYAANGALKRNSSGKSGG